MKFDRITVDPAVCGGKPCVRGLRFPVSRLLGLLAAGETRDGILQAYPYLEAADIDEALTRMQAARRIDRLKPSFVAMDYSKIITQEPGKRGGKPCIRGLRITVSDVLEYLAGGMSEDDILRDFPYLTREDIRACLAFAADR